MLLLGCRRTMLELQISLAHLQFPHRTRQIGIAVDGLCCVPEDAWK